MASERFDEFMRGAVTTGSAMEATYFAQLATAEALGRIANVLEEMWEGVKEETGPPLPCNAMGGGSAGLDTADDFAMHCKPDKHDGPHSYEREFTDAQPD